MGRAIFFALLGGLVLAAGCDEGIRRDPLLAVMFVGAGIFILIMAIAAREERRNARSR